MLKTAERLREAGLRVTAPRLAILAALDDDRTHPTAEHLYERLRREQPSLSLSTVYKTLEAFLRAGVCRRVPGEGTLRVDGITRVHDHAVCRGCGTVFDVERKNFPLPPLPAKLPHGLIVQDARIEYDVLCSTCRKS